MFAKYKTVIYAIVLSVISGIVAIEGSHVWASLRTSIVTNISGPSNGNVGDELEYQVVTENVPWFTYPVWQWSVIEITQGQVPFHQSPSGVFFGVGKNASKYYIICSGVAYHKYLVWEYAENLGVLVQPVVIGNVPPGPIPPVPPPVPPVPPPVPPVPTSIPAFALAIFDTNSQISLPAGQLSQWNSQTIKPTLKAMGVVWRTYDIADPYLAGTLVLKNSTTVGFPALALLDKGGKIISVNKLPPDEASTVAFIKTQ